MLLGACLLVSLATALKPLAQLGAAAQSGDYEKVVELLETEVDPNATEYGETLRICLMLAAEKGHKDVVRALLEKGADMEARDTEGFTPLITAAFHGHTNVVKVLLEAEWWRRKFLFFSCISVVDRQKYIDAATKDDCTALSLATTNGHRDTAAILREAGATERRRLALGELPVATLLALGVAGSLLLLGYLLYQFKRRLASKPRPVDTDLPTDLESGLSF